MSEHGEDYHGIQDQDEGTQGHHQIMGYCNLRLTDYGIVTGGSSDDPETA